MRGQGVHSARSRCSVSRGIFNREELDGTLTVKQKVTLEEFEECMTEMHSITERYAFSYGFRLGVQLMTEALLLPIGEDG